MTAKSHAMTRRFEKMFQDYKDHIYNYASGMLGDKDRAADISQEAFIRLYDHLRNKREVENPKSWLFIVARNLCLNQLRDSKKTATLETEPTINNTSELALPEKSRLNRALKSLRVNYREVLILKTYHQFTYDEIGTIMGLTHPAVRSLIYKARQELRKIYNHSTPGGEIDELRSY